MKDDRFRLESMKYPGYTFTTGATFSLPFKKKDPWTILPGLISKAPFNDFHTTGKTDKTVQCEKPQII